MMRFALVPLLLPLLLFTAVRVRGDDGQWGQFYARKEWEDYRQSQRNLDYYNRYDPNPRSTANLEPLRRQLMDWAARADEERRQRALERARYNQSLVYYLVETRRLAEQRAQEEARQNTLARWNALKQRAADGDVETSYRVARLIRWGEGRLPKEQKTGEAAARPWYQFAADKGHGDAALELALMVRDTSPAAALRNFTKAAEAGKVEALLPAADLAAQGVPGQVPPNPAEALRLYQLGANSNDAAVLTTGAYFLLRQPQLGADTMAQAISWLERAADREPAAAGKLALVRLSDQPGLPKDPALAVALAQQALVKQPGQPDALVTLGLAKFEGLGGEPVDVAGALPLLRQAATGGSLRACHLLALAYHNGLGGLPKSDPEVVRWREAGARLGHVQAMLELALRYRLGQGVERDSAASAQWLRAAAEGGSVPAMMELAGLMVAKDPLVRLEPVQLRALAERAAHEGNVEAQELCGAMALDGFGGPRNDKVALAWFRSAAEGGGRKGQYFLALHYLEGIEVTADPQEAYRWMRRSAEAGYGDACAHVAWHHATGTGCEQDVSVARDWARRGAELGSVLARRSYGTYLGDGIGGPTNGPEAIRQLTLAAEQNDDRARLQLARYLRTGLPEVPADREAARKHFEASARARDREVAAQAEKELATLNAPKPVSLDGLLIGKPAGRTNSSSIYESLKLR